MNLKIQIFLVAILGFSISEINAQQPPDFNAEKAAGIFEYDIEEVIEKLNITNENTKQKVTKALNAYNKKMYDLSIEHSSTFKELDTEFDKNVQIAMQRRDRSQMNGVKAKIKQVIPPIRKQVVAEEKVLNDAMAMLLTEKQNVKWLKYQKRKKE
jgi:uncharacterized ubiquitin-like protein YukD